MNAASKPVPREVRLQAQSPWRRVAVEFIRSPTAVVGLVALLIIVLVAVRGTGVDHPHVRVFDAGGGSAGGVVRQAENRDVAGVDRRGTALGVLALFGRQRDQREVSAALQPLVNLQAGGALVAVDENHWKGHGWVLV